MHHGIGIAEDVMNQHRVLAYRVVDLRRQHALVDIADPDGSALTSVTIQLSGVGPEAALESLVSDGSAPATIAVGIYDPMTGMLVLTAASGGTASHAEFEAAIQSIGYLNTSQDPTPGDRTVQVTVFDEGVPGVSPPRASVPATATITVEARNDAPTLDLDTFNLEISGDFDPQDTDVVISTATGRLTFLGTSSNAILSPVT